MDIYLIRHTTPDVEKGIVYGQLDLDVTSNFEEEVEVILELIPKKFAKIYSSPLKRCSILAKRIGGQFQTDSRIKELNFGEWEGLKWDDINPAALDRWMKNFTVQPPPAGETMAELKERVSCFWMELLTLTDAPLAVVTHAGVIRIIYSIILNKPLDSVFELKLEYGAVVKCNNVDQVFEVLR